MVNYKPKCLAIPLIHTKIPEISTNETKYKQISCELFFYVRKIGTILSKMSSENFIFLKEEITSAKRQNPWSWQF